MEWSRWVQYRRCPEKQGKLQRTPDGSLRRIPRSWPTRPARGGRKGPPGKGRRARAGPGGGRLSAPPASRRLPCPGAPGAAPGTGEKSRRRCPLPRSPALTCGPEQLRGGQQERGQAGGCSHRPGPSPSPRGCSSCFLLLPRTWVGPGARRLLPAGSSSPRAARPRPPLSPTGRCWCWAWGLSQGLPRPQLCPARGSAEGRGVGAWAASGGQRRLPLVPSSQFLTQYRFPFWLVKRHF